MTLFWPDDPLTIPNGQPLLHVFVVGVGEYPHLEGGVGPIANQTFGLSQLDTTTVTAERVANWFVAKAKPPIPLGSVELVVTSSGPVKRDDGTQINVQQPTMAEITTAFNAWYQRCKQDKDNIAIFYFAGHGLSTNTAQFLLPADFGDPTVLNAWANCIDFTGLKIGMGGNTAQTQVFFIDACRESPVDLLIQPHVKGDPLCTALPFQVVAQSSAYFAASDGFLAYGPPNDLTYFGRAVLDALDGAGAHKAGAKWSVNTYSLSSAIGLIMTQLAKVENLPLSCNPRPSGQSVVLHQSSSPFVSTLVPCDDGLSIQMTGMGQNLHSPGHEKRPWMGRAAPGDWQFVISDNATAVHSSTDSLMPPTYDLEIP